MDPSCRVGNTVHSASVKRRIDTPMSFHTICLLPAPTATQAHPVTRTGNPLVRASNTADASQRPPWLPGVSGSDTEPVRNTRSSALKTTVNCIESKFAGVSAWRSALIGPSVPMVMMSLRWPAGWRMCSKRAASTATRWPQSFPPCDSPVKSWIPPAWRPATKAIVHVHHPHLPPPGLHLRGHPVH